MMKNEEQLAKADLSIFKTAPVEAFAKGICKYRLFNWASAKDNLSYASYSEGTAKLAFNVLSGYLVTGTKVNTSIGRTLYEAVDKYKFVCPALTPNEDQKRRVVNQSLRTSKKEQNVPDFKCAETSQKFSYAVKLNHNTYKVFKTEKELEAFKDALELVGKRDEYEYVHLYVEEV